ncbi:MAG: hypothetical protein WDZ59_08065, partial [Pirellulales bacterium]
MRFSHTGTLIALAAAMSTSGAFAQYGIQQPASVRSAAYENVYDNYYAQDEPQASPSDLPAEAAPMGNGAVAYGCDGACGGGCASCCALSCPEENPWRLFP